MKKVILLPISLLVLLSVITIACEKETSEDICAPFQSPTCPALDFTACSDGDKDYIEYDGEKYVCDTNVAEGEEICDKEAEEIIDKAGCSASATLLKSGSSYKDFVLNAIKSVRAEALAAAGCN